MNTLNAFKVLLLGVALNWGATAIFAQAPPATPSPVPTGSENIPAKPVQERYEDVLEFWFGNLKGSGEFPEEKVIVWRGENLEIERQLRHEFADDMQRAAKGEYNEWRHSPHGRLALILLLDQFPRILYRNTPRAFGTDSMAIGLTLEGIQQGDDQHLYPIERVFFYMPLQHSENQRLQYASVQLYKQLLQQSPQSLKEPMQEFLRYALINQRVIDQFGRFPHRNAVMGRASTPAEMLYLYQRS